MDYKKQKEMPSQFLKLSEPYSQNLSVGGNKSSNSLAGIKKHRKNIRDILITDERGISYEALFKLKKILSIAVHLKISTETQWLLLNETIEAIFTSLHDSKTLNTFDFILNSIASFSI